MPVYGTTTAIKQLIRGVPGAEFTEDQDARITELQKFVSLYLEHETGATFGESPAPTETVVIDQSEDGPILWLPKGVRSVTSITEDPTWSGSSWTGGTALVTTDYRLTGLRTTGAYRSITRVDGGWSALVVILGVWEDKYPTVPDDVTYAVNYAAAQVYSKQQAGPAGFQGPDGATVPIRNVFREPEIRSVVEQYRVGAALAAI